LAGIYFERTIKKTPRVTPPPFSAKRGFTLRIYKYLRLQGGIMAKLEVTRKVKPGEYGTLKEELIYGDRLLAVRYLKDGDGRYVKTAEIIVKDRHVDVIEYQSMY
jgi:hypothetical protein